MGLGPDPDGPRVFLRIGCGGGGLDALASAVLRVEIFCDEAVGGLVAPLGVDLTGTPWSFTSGRGALKCGT